jgi:hypothetical protein
MAEPPDQVVLLRVIWWDRDYDQDELIASKVFPSDDLGSGPINSLAGGGLR